MPLPEFSSNQMGNETPEPLESLPAPSSGALAAVKEGAVQGIMGGLVTRASGALGDQTYVPYDDAAKEMKANGFDPSVLPKDGVSRGYLEALQDQQESVQRNEEIANRAGLAHRSGWMPSMHGIYEFAGGAAADSPFFLLSDGAAGMGAEAAGIGEAAELGRAGRIAYRATEGAALGAGQDVALKEAGTMPGDKDIGIYDVAHDAILYGAVGGILGGIARDTPKAGSKAAIDHVLQEEGGQTVDTGGETKFGISAKAHPGLDIANLDIGTARKIYKEEYWDKIDGDNLPGPMQLTALDSAVNQGVGKTEQWLKEANGDPLKFNALRKADYERLAQEDPEKYGKYLKGWLARLGRVGLSNINPYAAPELGMAARTPEEDIAATKQTTMAAMADRVPDPSEPTGLRPVWKTPETEAQIARAQHLPQPAELQRNEVAGAQVSPELHEITTSSQKALQEAQALAQASRPEDGIEALDTHMAQAQKEIEPQMDFYKALEAAVKCGTLKGLE